MLTMAFVLVACGDDTGSEESADTSEEVAEENTSGETDDSADEEGGSVTLSQTDSLRSYKLDSTEIGGESIMTKRKRRTFTKEFKEQIVQLYISGKSRADIIKEYELTPSSFDKWVRQHKSTGSFEEKDNRTPEQEELIKLRKRNQQLEMENDICT